MSGWIIPKDVPLGITVIVGDAPPIVLRAEMTAPTAVCPQCRHPSARIHSHYPRTLQDLPWQALPVQWLLGCRRFWCDHPACPWTVFGERLPARIGPGRLSGGRGRSGST